MTISDEEGAPDEVNPDEAMNFDEEDEEQAMLSQVSQGMMESLTEAEKEKVLKLNWSDITESSYIMTEKATVFKNRQINLIHFLFYIIIIF